MKLKIKSLLLAAIALPILAVAITPLSAVHAQDEINITSGPGSSRGDNTPENLVGEDGAFQTITNVLLF